MAKPNYHAIIAVFLIALVLRIGLLFTYRGTSALEQRDATDYQAIAVNIVKGNGFIGINGQPTEIRPPVYPLFLAAVYSLSGNSDLPVKLLQCFLDSLTAVLIMMTAGLIIAPAGAVLSGVFVAVYPPLILYSNLRLGETLFTFLLVAAVFFLVKGYSAGRTRFFAWSGVFLGLANLCRSTMLAFPFFLLAAALFLPEQRKLLKQILLLAVISGAITSVWTIRNYAVFRDFLPVNSGSGYLVWLAVQDDVWKGETLVERMPFDEHPDLRDMPWRRWEGILARRVMGWALTHPVEYAGKLAKNFVRLWYLPVGKVMLDRRMPAVADLYLGIYLVMLGFAAFGMYLAARDLRRTWPALLLLLYLSVMHSVVLAVPRYKLPFDPFVLLFAANGAVALYLKTKSRIASR